MRVFSGEEDGLTEFYEFHFCSDCLPPLPLKKTQALIIEPNSAHKYIPSSCLCRLKAIQLFILHNNAYLCSLVSLRPQSRKKKCLNAILYIASLTLGNSNVRNGRMMAVWDILMTHRLIFLSCDTYMISECRLLTN